MDDEYRLKGLITIKDIEKATVYPNSARDDKGRLLVGAAIGVTSDVLDRVRALVEAGADVLCLDSPTATPTIFWTVSAASRRSIPTCSSSPATLPPPRAPAPSSRRAPTA